ncbi:hypothetical protein [Ruegeria arenilitoris]|uniref:hypothetical protein n=1 Tax=Ruegeria arenilitoris TaxID=1173585 RepID=UPI00147BACA6|nr:hypothetical protein [Ruegeria arenilitoris]
MSFLNDGLRVSVNEINGLGKGVFVGRLWEGLALSHHCVTLGIMHPPYSRVREL